MTLGAGDPRIALDKLFERQQRLLMSVRSLWRQAEASRGELPHVPKLPIIPISQGGMHPAPTNTGCASTSGDSHLGGSGSAPGSARRKASEQSAPVGSFLVTEPAYSSVDDGTDEERALGSSSISAQLPEHLSDL